MTRDEKIVKIKQDRIELLKIVNENLKQNKNNVSNNIESIMQVLEYDEKNIKKYEAIVKAKKLIVELTEEIINAKDPNEISKIRNRLNYYINKIKNELKKRNVSEQTIMQYSDNMTNLRGEISKQIRYLKRNNNILELENLNGNYESLTDEDKEKFKKMLKNEVSFNHRNLPINKPNNEKIIFSSESKDKETTPNTTSNNSEKVTKESGIPMYIEPRKTTKLEEDKIYMGNNKDEEKQKNIEIEPKEIYEFFKHQAGVYNSRYNVIDINEYNNSAMQNIIIFIKNIPKYYINKKRIKKMECEYATYYTGDDLGGYIAYSKKRNSIMQGLKSIFDKTYLSLGEGQYLNNHEKCADWIITFFKTNSIDEKVLNKSM